MVAQAIPLIAVATGMTLSVPAVIEYFRNQKGIDLSGYGDNDLVPLEVLYPEKYKKEYKTWEGSYYKPEPVIADTDLSGVVLQSKKDDDEVIEVKEEELTRYSDKLDPDPEKDPDDERMLKELANLTIEELQSRLINKAYQNTWKWIEKEINTRQGLTFPKDKTDQNLKLHNLRLDKMKEKSIAYPGSPKNNRIVLQAPKNSDLPDIAIGKITFDDWTTKVEGNLSREEIFEAKNWYGKIFESFDKIAKGDEKESRKIATAWLAGQQNETPANALANVLYIYEQYNQGVPFDQIKGKGLPPANLVVKSIIFDKEIEGGVGQKISDFIDSGNGKDVRAIMGNNSEGGSPFVIDIHSGRDTGLVDQTYLNSLKKLGYVIPDNIAIDLSEGGITGTKYENRALWGRNLTKYLNEINWLGKNDWKTQEVQAIGWTNTTDLTAQLGTAGDIDAALARNYRRISMEAAPGDGSPWKLEFGDSYQALDVDDQFRINESVTSKAIEMVNELTGINLSGIVHGTGGWELYQNPSTVQEGYISKDTALEAASFLGYLLNQTEVWVNSAKALTKNPQHFGVDIIEYEGNQLRDNSILTQLQEKLIEADPNGLFRGFQPIIVDGQAGIRIIIDNEIIKKSDISKKKAVEYIQNFTNNELNEITNSLNIDTINYISEIDLTKLVNDWTEETQGGNYKNYFSEKFTGPSKIGEGTLIDYYGKQLTDFFAEEIKKAITKETKSITQKKRAGGIVEIPHFHYGGFVDVNRL